LLPKAERVAVGAFEVARELVFAVADGRTPLLGAMDGPAAVFLATVLVGVVVLVALGELGFLMEDGDCAADTPATAVAGGST
jgi:hypothetical protein